MAITALATSNTTIGPAQYADMTQVLTARFKVDSPTDLQPSIGTNRTTRVNTGAGFAAGTRLRSSVTETVTHEAVTSGTRIDAVVIRVNWTNPTATLAVVKGTASSVPINTSSSPDTTKINRIPGVMYDALVCTVVVSAGSTVVSNLIDYRMFGGDGGPFRVSDGALAAPNLLDARIGTFISTDRSLYTKRLDNDGLWRDVGTASNPWREWTPTFRYHGKTPPNGTTGGTPVSIGTGGTYSGRYRVVDGMLDGFVSVTTGTFAAFGEGPLTLDLPLPCAGWQPDTWSMGHIFTDTSTGGDGLYDWHAEVLIKAGWTQGLMWTNPSQDNARLEPHRSTDPYNPVKGTGVPYIAGGFGRGVVYTFNLTYPVG